jgi:transglutaminase 1
VGNWSGKYEDGTAPAAWTGSLAIVEEYFEKLSLTGRLQPVKYGQCWVFAGVLATFCRAIGIPCRVVTNFESAHDTNETLTIDRYYDESSKYLDHDPFNSSNKDSIWNFHVWNDVWMARPDLEAGGAKGYGGWQAIDATPQEASEGVYQCGPASLEAVRRGQLGLAYDVPFILAEVNADVVYWKEDRQAKRGYRRLNADKIKIGRMILTKKPNVNDTTGNTDYVDILEEYKAKEGSRMERLALYAAASGKAKIAEFQGRSDPGKTDDVEFSLLDLDKIPVGEPFTVVVTMQNKSKETRTVQVNLKLNSMYYTGLKAKDVKDASGRFVLRAGANEELKMTVLPKEYMKKLVEYGIMKVSAICAVDETSQAWLAEDDFQIQKPCLNLEVNPELKIHQPASVKITFKNPLRRELTSCSVNYEGPGLVRTKTIPQPNVNALEEFTYEHQFVPKSVGNQRIVMSFTSTELTDIIGSAVIDITA